MPDVFNAAYRFYHILRRASWHLAYFLSIPFRQPNEEIFQSLNLDGCGGALSRVFFDHFAQVRLEDALGAQKRVGRLRGRLQTELINQRRRKAARRGWSTDECSFHRAR